MKAVALTQNLQTCFSRRLSPTIAYWDFPNFALDYGYGRHDWSSGS